MPWRRLSFIPLVYIMLRRDLSDNQLKGPIPTGISDLTKLSTMYVGVLVMIGVRAHGVVIACTAAALSLVALVLAGYQH